MQVLIDVDGNSYNVKLIIDNHKLIATWEGDEENHYIVDLQRDDIKIKLNH